MYTGCSTDEGARCYDRSVDVPPGYDEPHSLMFTPILENPGSTKQKLIGVVAVGNKLRTRGEDARIVTCFSDDDQRMLEFIASILARPNAMPPIPF